MTNSAKTLDITEAELLAMLEQATSESDPGFTMKEIAERMGSHVRKARENMAKLIDAGAWRYSGERRVTRIDGKANTVPVYMPVEAVRKRKAK